MEEASKHWENGLRALERTLPASRLSWAGGDWGGEGGSFSLPRPSPPRVPNGQQEPARRLERTGLTLSMIDEAVWTMTKALWAISSTGTLEKK